MLPSSNVSDQRATNRHTESIHSVNTQTTHVLGLQRAGTNYLASLARINLCSNVLPSGDRSICWKHALPNERTPQQSSAAEAVCTRSDVFICLIAKHPYHWIASVTLRNPQDLFLKRKALLQEGQPNVVALCNLYTTFYQQWLDVLSTRGRYTLVRYEELLASPHSCIQRIATTIGLSCPLSLKTVDNVPYSRKPCRDTLMTYLTGMHGLEPSTVCEVAAHTDNALLRRMGYTNDPPAFTVT